MGRIDPTARIADGARVADDVEVGPYCIVGAGVELKAGVRLIAHVHIAGVTAVGEKTVVHPFASLGGPPQSVRYRGSPTRLVIGANCDIREGVTMNTGTEDGGGVTKVGDRCFFMAGSHVAHDCAVGHDVTFANNVIIGGHVTVGDYTFIGGNSGVHQFVRIGEGAMMAGMTGVADDIIPFGFALGQRGELVGLNVVGLKRRGVSRADLHRLRHAYRLLFHADGSFAERAEAVAHEFGSDPIVGKIVAFIQQSGNRKLMKARAEGNGKAAPDGEHG